MRQEESFLPQLKRRIKANSFLIKCLKPAWQVFQQVSISSSSVGIRNLNQFYNTVVP